EFAILLEDTPKDEARRAANAIREALREPYAVDGREVALTASVGLLVIKPGARRARYADGLRETDRALYAAKAAGGDRVVEAVAGQPARSRRDPAPATAVLQPRYSGQPYVRACKCAAERRGVLSVLPTVQRGGEGSMIRCLVVTLVAAT